MLFAEASLLLVVLVEVLVFGSVVVESELGRLAPKRPPMAVPIVTNILPKFNFEELLPLIGGVAPELVLLLVEEVEVPEPVEEPENRFLKKFPTLLKKPVPDELEELLGVLPREAPAPVIPMVDQMEVFDLVLLPELIPKKLPMSRKTFPARV